MTELRRALEADERIAYALVFGSQARNTAHAGSDVDVAVGLAAGVTLDTLALGGLIANLEAAAGRPIDLVLLDEAPPGLAYRVFRDGQPLMVRDHEALKSRFVRAVLEYLDFRPIEELFAQGVLRRRHGR